MMGSSPATTLPRSTYLLTLAQAVNLTAAVISVTIAALVGSAFAPSPAWGTVPYGVQFASVMLFTYPASLLMRRYGRKAVFYGGSGFLVGSGVVGYAAVTTQNFKLLIAAHALLGVYISCANFYRFAAVDNLAPQAKARAISWVVAGGVLAAVVGPLLANQLRLVAGQAEFSMCYGALSMLGALSLFILYFWRPSAAQKPVSLDAGVPQSAAAAALSARPHGLIVTAVFSAGAGYLVMNFLMIQSSLVLKGICSFELTSRAIQIHVLAMFLPSFFTGALISALGLRNVLLLGFSLLAGAAGFGLAELEYSHVTVGLLLLGAGWNFVYVGGGALLAKSVQESDRHRWQGLNDTVVAACATLGAFLPAPLLSMLGWHGSNLLVIPLCAVGVFFCFWAMSPAIALKPPGNKG